MKLLLAVQIAILPAFLLSLTPSFAQAENLNSCSSFPTTPQEADQCEVFTNGSFESLTDSSAPFVTIQRVGYSQVQVAYFDKKSKKVSLFDGQIVHESGGSETFSLNGRDCSKRKLDFHVRVTGDGLWLFDQSSAHRMLLLPRSNSVLRNPRTCAR